MNNLEYVKVLDKIIFYDFVIFGILEWIFLVAIVVVLFFGGRFVLVGNLDFGILFFFILYV